MSVDGPTGVVRRIPGIVVGPAGGPNGIDALVSTVVASAVVASTVVAVVSTVVLLAMDEPLLRNTSKKPPGRGLVRCSGVSGAVLVVLLPAA